MTKPKQLPCTVCGEPVTIPAKYARSKGAVCTTADQSTQLLTPRPYAYL